MKKIKAIAISAYIFNKFGIYVNKPTLIKSEYRNS